MSNTTAPKLFRMQVKNSVQASFNYFQEIVDNYIASGGYSDASSRQEFQSILERMDELADEVQNLADEAEMQAARK